jgi:hypothetical protein
MAESGHKGTTLKAQYEIAAKFIKSRNFSLTLQHSVDFCINPLWHEQTQQFMIYYAIEMKELKDMYTHCYLHKDMYTHRYLHIYICIWSRIF